MANKDMASLLIDKMYELQETYESVLSVREKNRRTLRDLADQNLLTEEQVAAITEVYPERAARKTLAERAQEAQDRAQELADKAAAEAAEGN